jgi:DNA-binding NtrC family response regulator
MRRAHSFEDPQEPKGRKASVLIVCDNDETLLGLRNYLTGAGIAARATRDVADALKQSASVDALVVFPDDFDTGDVMDRLLQLLPSSGDRFVIVVTAESQSFASLLQAAGDTRSVIIPKPVWGWTILEVLRRSLGAPT